MAKISVLSLIGGQI